MGDMCTYHICDSRFTTAATTPYHRTRPTKRPPSSVLGSIMFFQFIDWMLVPKTPGNSCSFCKRGFGARQFSMSCTSSSEASPVASRHMTRLSTLRGSSRGIEARGVEGDALPAGLLFLSLANGAHQPGPCAVLSCALPDFGAIKFKRFLRGGA